MAFTGELIAIITVLCWTVSVQLFGAAAKRVGATPVNIIRMTSAFIMFCLLIYLRDGSPVPPDFPARAWFYLIMSGVIGFFIGDIFLFKALVELGPRLAMLMHSLAAPASAIIGWLLLGETYGLLQWTGIVVTLCGVGMVILERNTGSSPSTKNRRGASMLGVGLGLGAMLGQAGGFVLSKVGMQVSDGYLDAFSATYIRVIGGLVCFYLYYTVRGRWRDVHLAVTNTRACLYTVSGAFIGPFVGVSLSLFTLHYLSAGVAATILSLVPICIIPFAVFVHKEKVSFKSVAGAFIAVFGVFLLVH